MTRAELQFLVSQGKAIPNKVYTVNDKGRIRTFIGIGNGRVRETTGNSNTQIVTQTSTNTSGITSVVTDGTTITGNGTTGSPLTSLGVQSVTDDTLGGITVDNTDPLNPIVGISVVVDGVSITGDGTTGNPLVGAAGTPQALTTAEIAYGDGANLVTSDPNLTFDDVDNIFKAGSTLYLQVEGDDDTFSLWDGTGGIFFLGPACPYGPTPFKGIRVDVQSDNYQIGNTLGGGSNVYIDDAAGDITIEASNDIIVPSLGGGGTLMVTTDNAGLIGTAAIPTAPTLPWIGYQSFYFYTDGAGTETLTTLYSDAGGVTFSIAHLGSGLFSITASSPIWSTTKSTIMGTPYCNASDTFAIAHVGAPSTTVYGFYTTSTLSGGIPNYNLLESFIEIKTYA